MKILPEASGKKGVIIAVAVLLIGVILIIVGTAGNRSDKSVGNQIPETWEASDAAAELEKRLCRLLSEIEGVGAVKVAVTLRNCGEDVYARDGDGEYVILKDGSALCVSRTEPEILGVAVACDGGGNDALRLVITELICSLCGIGASSVYVTARSSG